MAVVADLTRLRTRMCVTDISEWLADAGRLRPNRSPPRLAQLVMANIVLNAPSLRKITGGRMSAADIFAESKRLKKSHKFTAARHIYENTITKTQ